TVRGNTAFGLEAAGVPKRERAARCEEILERVGLARFQGHYPAQLSGGMQQRLAIARALVCRPTILLMDEPFSAVDALPRPQSQDLVVDVWAEYGLTIVFVTEDVDEAVYLSDRVVALGRHPDGITMDRVIDLPRPRSQLATRETPEFLANRRA